MEREEAFESRVDLTALKNSVDEIRTEIRKIIVGQDRMVDLLVTAILANGHVLIEGVPGVAKTLTAKVLSKVIEADFSRIQFTPDLMPSDVLGTSVFNMKTADFEFKAGPIFSNIILIDEINRAPAKTQAALFEVMEERQVTIDGHTHIMDEPYLVVATQNPIEQEGTYRLPEAQLDRFLFKVSVNYPTLDQEVSILEGHNEQRIVKDLSHIKPVLKKSQINEYRKTIGDIHVEQNLLKYIAQIVNETRNSHDLYLGASPRASIAILHTAKAFAAIQGRDFVTPEDIKSMAKPVIRHRVIITPEKEMEGLGSDEITQQIIDKIEVPR
ncbi:MAG: MoxR family ATPase [Fulvivirga sp.]|nr:MoxR family ATPase [Fulvivirga sp.]